MTMTFRDKIAVAGAMLVLVGALGCSEDSTSSRERLMALSATSLDFTAWSGSNPNPAQQKITVTLEGRATAGWSAWTNSDWIRIGPGGSDTVFVTVISASLSAGIYEDTVMVELTDATNSPRRSIVRLNVLNRVNLSPELLRFTSLAGDITLPPQDLIIANFGVDTAGYTAETQAPWLILSSYSGQMPDTIQVSADITGLAAGFYIDSIVVNSPDLPSSRAVVLCYLSLSSWASFGLGPGNTGTSLEDIEFIDPQTGWTSGWLPSSALEPHGQVFRSGDGGQTWTRVFDRIKARFGGLAAIDAARCFVVGDRAEIFLTADSGHTWNPIASSPIDSTVSLRDILFSDPAHGWVIGTGGTILRSADSGHTWSKRPTPTSQDLTDMVFLDSQTGWVSGNHGTILHTGDGGATWVAQSSGTILDLRGISFTDNLNGWAAGANGKIIHTTNGGATWQPIGEVSDMLLLDVVFVDNMRGWVVGIDGSISRSDDGGTTWVEQESGTTQILTNIFFWDDKLGWAVGSAGTVIKTANGGF